MNTLLTETDHDHLTFIHDRLLHVYKEDYNADYMIRLREIIQKIKIYGNRKQN